MKYIWKKGHHLAHERISHFCLCLEDFGAASKTCTICLKEHSNGTKGIFVCSLGMYILQITFCPLKNYIGLQPLVNSPALASSWISPFLPLELIFFTSFLSFAVSLNGFPLGYFGAQQFTLLLLWEVCHPPRHFSYVFPRISVFLTDQTLIENKLLGFNCLLLWCPLPVLTISKVPMSSTRLGTPDLYHSNYT